MNRRRFLTGLAGILASGVAPAVVPAGSIMRIKPVLVPGKDFVFTVEDVIRGASEVLENEIPLAYLPGSGIALLNMTTHEYVAWRIANRAKGIALL